MGLLFIPSSSTGMLSGIDVVIYYTYNHRFCPCSPRNHYESFPHSIEFNCNYYTDSGKEQILIHLIIEYNNIIHMIYYGEFIFIF